MNAEPGGATQSNLGQRRQQARGQGNESYVDRRAEIVDAAAQLFRIQGYASTSLAQVAARVGSDRATIYYYFSSKEELLDTLVTDVVNRNLEIAEKIAASMRQASDKLRTLIVQLMRSYADNYPLLYVYLQENMAHVAPKRKAWADEMRAVNRRYEQAIIRMVDDGVKEGSLKAAGDSRVVAFGIMGMISWTHRWFNPHTADMDAESIGQTYADIILSGLATPV